MLLKSSSRLLTVKPEFSSLDIRKILLIIVYSFYTTILENH